MRKTTGGSVKPGISDPSGLKVCFFEGCQPWRDCVPGFERLLTEQGNDLPRFYAAAKELSRLPMAERHERLCRSPEAVTLPPVGPAATAGAQAP